MGIWPKETQVPRCRIAISSDHYGTLLTEPLSNIVSVCEALLDKQTEQVSNKL